MKKKLWGTLICSIIITMLIASCKKETIFVIKRIIPPAPPVLLKDSLTGLEFTYNDVICIEDFDVMMDNYYSVLSVPLKPEVIKTFPRPTEVSFKWDSSSVWIYPHINYRFDRDRDFWYYYSNKSLRILSTHLYRDLIGKRALIRIKFL